MPKFIKRPSVMNNVTQSEIHKKRSYGKLTDENRLSMHCDLRILDEWSDENPKGPDEYSKGSGAKVWWKCSVLNCGYEWDAIITSRTRRSLPSGCPACSGYIVTDKNRLSMNCE